MKHLSALTGNRPTLTIGRLAIAALLCLAFTGCQSHTSRADLGGGYVEINRTPRTLLPPTDDQLPRTSLAHKDTEGNTTIIWPSLYCFNEVVHDDTALFVAERAYVRDGTPSIKPRLFAVRFPAPPLDITEEVLWHWAKANHKDFYKTLGRYNVAIPRGGEDGLQVNIEFWAGGYMNDADWPDTGSIELTWKELNDIMADVQKKGTPQKDLRWHTHFTAENL